MNKLSMAALAATTLLLSACGEVVQVPSGTVARGVSSSGVSSQIYRPGGMRLTPCWWGPCPYVILLEATDQAVEERMEIILSSGGEGQAQQLITIGIDTRLTVRINDDNQQAILTIFDRIPPKQVEGSRYSIIDLADVYNAFGRNIVRTTVRNLLSQRNLGHFLLNRATAETEIREVLTRQFSSLPVELVQFGFGNVILPASVREAQEQAERRRIEIQNAESQRQIAQINSARELETAQRNQQIQLLRARTEAEVNTTIANSVTPAWITYRHLQVLDSIGRNPSTIFFPMEMITNPGMATGLANRIFNTNPTPLSQPLEELERE